MEEEAPVVATVAVLSAFVMRRQLASAAPAPRPPLLRPMSPLPLLLLGWLVELLYCVLLPLAEVGGDGGVEEEEVDEQEEGNSGSLQGSVHAEEGASALC